MRLTADGYGIRDRGLRPLANPADLCALEQAMRMAREQRGNLTVFSIGPARVDDLLRLGLSLGAHRAVRVWHPAFEGGDVVAESHLLQRVVEILDCDYFVTGTRLLDRGSDPVPALAAAGRNVPCVTAAVDYLFQNDEIRVLRKSDRGAKQVVALKTPCTLLFEDGCCEMRYPDQGALMRALAARIEHWGLAELGLPLAELGSCAARLRREQYGVPRPNPKRVVTPDATLPAFDRILALLSGGIKPREGKLNQVSPGETVEKLVAIFRSQGLLAGGQK
ncbi:electron transfer flavoprotein subunit beta [Desulfuromonas thiophila]|uniref:electron transfer flavoprotein subunit beta/FixA family protein n=1 Tax=Desulfuromonas thiophila TaxID=57664 RepID=UPI0029F4FFAD|nr:electron transfer flavoprotein subunit beta [Desulfuromonas thiophila]